MSRGFIVFLIIGLLGFPSSQTVAQDFKKAVADFKRGSYEAALKEWRPLAQKGDPASQFNLGLLYSEGLGVRQDYERAMIWYRKAAAQGNANAQNNLGVFYALGLGVNKDPEKALSWFRKAAAQGNVFGRNNLSALSKEAHVPDLDIEGSPRYFRNAFRIQLGSYKSESSAAKQAAHLSRIYKPFLSGRKILVVQTRLDRRGVFYRVQTGLFGDRDSADAVCRKLLALGQQCIVIKP